MNQVHTDATETGESTERESTMEIETRPTIKPTLVWLGLTVGIGLLLTGYVITRPKTFGGTDTANLVANAIVLLTAIGVIRFAVHAYVLTRTRYIVTERMIAVSYSLLMRTWSRRVPHRKIRSHEYTQSRIQNLFGYGTISVNQGLGDIELENVPNPERVHQRIGELIKTNQQDSSASRRRRTKR